MMILALQTLAFLGVAHAGHADRDLFPIEKLGGLIYNDPNLSMNRNQSCASCHDLEWGGTNPDSIINSQGAVSEGSFTDRFGNRKPPSSTYATLSPIFHLSMKVGGGYVGGNFWDGRATGMKLGNPAADQAQGPFLNPVEQALPDAACVVYRVSVASYASIYTDVWGDSISSIGFPADMDSLCQQEGVTIPLDNVDRLQVEMEYDKIALAIAAFEDSPEVNRFSSRFDANSGHSSSLTAEEQWGYELFKGKAKCDNCHDSSGRNAPFTDFTYDNLGIPKNPENPAFIADPAYVDLGLGGYLKNSGQPANVYEPEMGKMKVPSLRNVDKRPSPEAVKAYTHNGYFKSLKGVVHFYNTRDVKARCPGDYTESEALAENCWPAPEVEQNVNTIEIGNLGLTDEEENAIVAFLKALSDDSSSQRHANSRQSDSHHYDD